MCAKRSSTNIFTALAAITSPFRLLRCGRFPRSKRSHSNVLGTATLVLLTLLAFSLTPSSPSAATTRTVCASSCDFTTITAAIAAASAGDTVSILDAVHTEANITVNKNLTIQGQGAANTAVDGGASGSVFIINGGVTATIQDMTIRNGSAFLGGGIYNNGTVTISNSTLSGNSADFGGGIGNVNDGTVTISNSTLTGNSATFFGGGGIGNDNGGTVTISNSTLSGNSATQTGGGIFNHNNGTLTLGNSTLSGNSATSGGGILNNIFGTVTISNSTLSGNSATFFGGGIFNVNIGRTNVKNSIVGNNSAGDCAATINALGANLDTDGTCGKKNFTQVTSGDLNLGPLALNPPGTTATQALLPGSAAIDAAPDCTDGGNPVTTDQRGVTRPDNGESACDIGAFESVDETPFFTGKLEVAVSTGSFDLNSSFSLGAGSDGINPVAENVTLQIGPYSVTIPAGSFTLNSKGAYVFQGVMNGVSLQLKITPVGGNSYTLQAEGSGANLTVISNPVTVTLTIGNDTVSTQITAGIS